MIKRKLNRSGEKRQRSYIVFFILLLCDLIFVYLHKYIFKNLSLSEFNFYRIGNLLDFVFFVIPAIGFIVLYFNPNKLERKYYSILVSIMIFLNLPLVGYSISSRIKIPFPVNYLFEYPIEKVFTAALFVVFGIISVLLSVFIWVCILKPNKHFFVRTIIYTLFITLSLVFFTFFYSNNFIRTIDFSEENIKKADVAVVLGAAVWSKNKPSPIFASRIKKAQELYKEKIIDKIQVTGGNAPGELSEARVAYNYLVNRGIRPRDIWMEENTSSTADQIEYIRKVLADGKGVKDILVVSDPVHLKRVIEICKFYNLHVKGIASDLELSWEKSFYYRVRDSLSLLLFWLYAI